jgi:hypothetical protein
MTKRKKRTPKGWTPFTPYDLTNSRYAKLKDIVNVYENNRFIVQVYNINRHTKAVVQGAWPHMIWLSIKTKERDAIKDWRDLMRIKNELAGTACEAVELYPNEGRLIDTSNQFHLWVFPPGLCFPFGYMARDVQSPETCKKTEPGAIQRGFQSHHAPGVAAKECPEIGPIWDDVKLTNDWYVPQEVPKEMPTFDKYPDSE